MATKLLFFIAGYIAYRLWNGAGKDPSFYLYGLSADPRKLPTKRKEPTFAGSSR